jgi:hypothetical protein
VKGIFPKREVSGRFFEKKLRKKLLLPWGIGGSNAHAPRTKKFFGSFFQKRTSCFLNT